MGPDDLKRISGLLEKTDASISLSVNLGDYNPERAADLVKHGARIFGKCLVAVSIGNEPNGFAPQHGPGPCATTQRLHGRSLRGGRRRCG